MFAIGYYVIYTCTYSTCTWTVTLLWSGIATAAIEMLGGDVALKMSRKPEIMADAAFAIITKNSKEFTGNFLIDEDLLRQEGVKDFDQYAHCPGEICTHTIFVLILQCWRCTMKPPVWKDHLSKETTVDWSRNN